MSNFKDNFKGKSLNLKKWEYNTKNYSSISIKDNNLIFENNSEWTGLYVRPKIKLNPNIDIMITYKYKIESSHYTTADKPYVAFINYHKKYNRENRYNMIYNENDIIYIYFCDNYDSSIRSKFYIYFGNKEIDSVNVKYKQGDILDIKIIFDKGILSLYDGDKLLMETKIDDYKILGKRWAFELNSNSYGYFKESISNFEIKNNSEKYLLSYDNKYYSIKDDHYNTNTTNYNGIQIDNLSEEQFDKYGFDIYTLLDSSITIKNVNFTPLEILEFSKFKLLSYIKED